MCYAAAAWLGKLLRGHSSRAKSLPHQFTPKHGDRLPLLKLILWIPILAGCQIQGGRTVDAKPSTQIVVSQAMVEVDTVHALLVAGNNSVLAMLDKLTVENLATEVPVIKARVVEADTHIQTAQGDLGEAAKSAKADAGVIQTQTAKIASLEKSDPVKTWLDLIGLGAVILGVLALVLSVAVPAINAIAWIRTVAVAAVLFGFMLLTIAHFLTTIYWVAGLTLLAAAIAGAVWVWLHRSVIEKRLAWNELAPEPK